MERIIRDKEAYDMKEAELAALRIENGRAQTNQLMRNISVLLSKLAALERDPSSSEYNESYTALTVSINRIKTCISRIPVVSKPEGFVAASDEESLWLDGIS